MRKLLLTSCLLVLMTPEAMAEGLPKFEVFGGYNFVRTEGGQANLHGGYLGFAKPVNNWFGIAAEVSGLSRSQTFKVVIPSGQMNDMQADAKFVSVGFGPRFTYKGEKPHALFGLARAVWKGPPSVSGAETSFGAAVGGGLDAKLGDHVGFRMFQVDYVLTRFGGGIKNNFRLGVGLTFSF